MSCRSCRDANRVGGVDFEATLSSVWFTVDKCGGFWSGYRQLNPDANYRFNVENPFPGECDLRYFRGGGRGRRMIDLHRQVYGCKACGSVFGGVLPPYRKEYRCSVQTKREGKKTVNLGKDRMKEKRKKQRTFLPRTTKAFKQAPAGLRRGGEV